MYHTSIIRNWVWVRWNLIIFKIFVKLEVYFKTHVKTQGDRLNGDSATSINIHLMEFYAAIKHFNTWNSLATMTVFI